MFRSARFPGFAARFLMRVPGSDPGGSSDTHTQIKSVSSSAPAELLS